MSSTSRSAFTLIEVLVVVAIIALLVAVLLPSLSAAREQAQTVVCKTRMKELYNGHAFYGADNKQRFPHWDSWLYDGYNHQYLQGNNIYGKFGGNPPSDPQARITLGSIYKYIKNKEAYFCPKDSKRRSANAIGGYSSPIHSYSRHFEPHYFALWQKTGKSLSGGTWNAYLSYVDSVDVMTPDMIRPSLMAKAAALNVGVPCTTTPDRVGLMFEEWQSADEVLQSSSGDLGYHDLNDGYSAPMTSPSDHITTRHNRQRGHILYWDGHSSLVDGKKLNMYAQEYNTRSGGVPTGDARYAAVVIIGANKN